MRPLETLHNNLCFKNLNNFLTRMINDRHSPYDSSTSSLKANNTDNDLTRNNSNNNNSNNVTCTAGLVENLELNNTDQSEVF